MKFFASVTSDQNFMQKLSTISSYSDAKKMDFEDLEDYFILILAHTRRLFFLCFIDALESYARTDFFIITIAAVLMLFRSLNYPWQHLERLHEAIEALLEERADLFDALRDQEEGIELD